MPSRGAPTTTHSRCTGSRRNRRIRRHSPAAPHRRRRSSSSVLRSRSTRPSSSSSSSNSSGSSSGSEHPRHRLTHRSRQHRRRRSTLSIPAHTPAHAWVRLTPSSLCKRPWHSCTLHTTTRRPPAYPLLVCYAPAPLRIPDARLHLSVTTLGRPTQKRPSLLGARSAASAAHRWARPAREASIHGAVRACSVPGRRRPHLAPSTLPAPLGPTRNLTARAGGKQFCGSVPAPCGSDLVTLSPLLHATALQS